MTTVPSSSSIPQSRTCSARRLLVAGALLLPALAALSSSIGTAKAAPCVPSASGAECTSTARPTPTASAPRPAPESNTPAITINAHLSTFHLHQPDIYDVAFKRLTLSVTGTNFRPGSRVSLVVVNTSTWSMLFKGSTLAQPSVLPTRCPGGYAVGCTQPNPKAGTIAYQIRLDDPPNASDLEVLYRSGQQTRIHDVIVQ